MLELATGLRLWSRSWGAQEGKRKREKVRGRRRERGKGERWLAFLEGRGEDLKRRRGGRRGGDVDHGRSRSRVREEDDKDGGGAGLREVGMMVGWSWAKTKRRGKEEMGCSACLEFLGISQIRK